MRRVPPRQRRSEVLRRSRLSAVRGSAVPPPSVPDCIFTGTPVCKSRLDNSSGQLVVQVDITGSVCNDGNVDVLNITVTDSDAGTVAEVREAGGARRGADGSLSELHRELRSFSMRQSAGGRALQV